MYGFDDKQTAEEKAEQLRLAQPLNKFTVEPYSWSAWEPTRLPNGEINESAARSWGVVRYVPYCEKMPYRCTGFVWF